MGTTPDLGLPELAQQQANPDVTVNTTFALLASLLKGVVSLGDNAPPGSPTEGDAYVLGAAPTGAWAGKANKLAVFIGGAWSFVPGVDDSGTNIAIGARHEGMRVWVNDEDQTYMWDGAAWVVNTAQMRDYTVATVPSAALPRRLIYVTNETGGAVPAFNDGTNWRRVTDRAVVS
jgi:uncharacterized protein DUF2793